MQALIYYHSKDLDGKCSGAIARKALIARGYSPRDIDLVGIDYGQENLLYRNFSEYRTVVMVDWSASNDPKRMEWINNSVKEFIWIDHHETAIKKLEGISQSIKGRRVIGKAGCELTWEYFFPDNIIPKGVEFLGRYDVWDKSYFGGFEFLLDFQNGMRLDSWLPDSPGWDEFLDASLAQLSQIAWIGGNIREYQKRINKDDCAKGFKAKIMGIPQKKYRIFALNTFQKSSQTFKSVWHDYDIFCAFTYEGNRWSYSLYSEEVDVGSICLQLGGGGHKDAAGFESEGQMVFPLGAENDV